MCNAVVRRLVLAGLGLCLVLGSRAATPCSAAEPDVDPRLQALVSKHLNGDPNYAPGDLISRGNIEPIYGELLDLGIQPFEDHERAYGDFLRDGDFLVQTLRSPQGRAFMRQACTKPEAYDLLERLSWSPLGRTWLQQLVTAENGPELFARLMTDEGLASLAEQFKDDDRARNFGLPTGRVHTEAELLAKLQAALAVQNRKTAAKSN